MAALRRFGPLVAGTVLLLMYLARISYAELLRHAGGFPWWTAAGVLALNFVPGILKLARWRMLTGPVAAGRAKRYLAVNAAFFWGLVTPGTAGELARASLLGDRSGRGVAVVLLEKFTDMGVLALCVVFAGIAHLVSARGAALLALPILALSFGAVRLLLRYDRLFTVVPKAMLAILLTPSRLSDAKQMYWDFHRLAKDTGLFFRSALFSAMLWLLPLAQMVLLYRGLGAHLPVGAVALGFFLPYLAGVLSMVPLGIGVFDLGLGRMSVLFGSAAGAAALGPVFFRALVTLPLILFGYGCHWALSLSRRPRAEDTH